MQIATVIGSIDWQCNAKGTLRKGRTGGGGVQLLQNLHAGLDWLMNVLTRVTDANAPCHITSTNSCIT